MRKSPREAAYRTLVEPIPTADVARELGVSLAFINRRIEMRDIRPTANGKITGVELARYLSSKKRDGLR